MKTELLDPDDPAWAAFLSDARHDFYHLPAYASVCAAQEEGEAKAILVTDGGRSLLLPLVLRPIMRGGRDATSPYGYPGPVVRGSADASFVAGALASGLSLLASEGVVSLFVRLHPILNGALPEGVWRDRAPWRYGGHRPDASRGGALETDATQPSHPDQPRHCALGERPSSMRSGPGSMPSSASTP